MLKKVTMITAIAAAALLFAPNAFAGGAECFGGACGTPDTSGGGGCGCGGGSILIANSDLGDTYQFSDDWDNDGREDDVDNCPFIANALQEDGDGDLIGNACDNCLAVANQNQFDVDGDNSGDACDGDIDGDGILNPDDLCPSVVNPGQLDLDGDGIGNACDIDLDGDGFNNDLDNCPNEANPNQAASTAGLNCFNDTDGDGTPDHIDNCFGIANPDQLDTNTNGVGNACDPDMDGDGVPNLIDNCALVANTTQIDLDRDGKGAACDPTFCMNVLGSPVEECLDPNAPFKVTVPDLLVDTGVAVRLPIFTNRADPIIVKFKILSQPGNSVIKNPIQNLNGAQTAHLEMLYPKGEAPTLTADEPGQYQVQVNAELAFADTLLPGAPTASQAVMTITAEGQSAGGCSVNGNSGTGAALLVAFGLMLAIRRRRS